MNFLNDKYWEKNQWRKVKGKKKEKEKMKKWKDIKLRNWNEWKRTMKKKIKKFGKRKNFTKIINEQKDLENER